MVKSHMVLTDQQLHVLAVMEDEFGDRAQPHPVIARRAGVSSYGIVHTLRSLMRKGHVVCVEGYWKIVK